MVEYPPYELLRKDRLPHILCQGCGIGTMVTAMLEAIIEHDVDLEKFVFVSGIGCSSRVPGYLNFDSLHTTHGRALAFATGIKLANPELEVVVVTGDGDMASIGGNHFLHSARRNVDLITLCVNNYNYGMTGGQSSPTTPLDWKSTTTPYGAEEPPMDIARVAEAAGANYVARWTTASPLQIKQAMAKSLEKEGFRLIEVLAQCPVAFGRRNKLRTAMDMLEWYKDNTISLERAREQEEGGADISNMVVVGEFADRDKPGLCRQYGLVEEEEEKEIEEEKERVRKLREVKVDNAKILQAMEKLSSPKAKLLLEKGDNLEEIEKLLREEKK